MSRFCAGALSFAFLLSFLLLSFILWPGIDLGVSSLFAAGAEGFVLRHNSLLLGLGQIAFWGARVLGLALVAGLVVAWLRKKPTLGLAPRAWLFLLLALLIGPGLLANVVFKDHWGRARPREIVAFGGAKTFTPAFVVSDQCRRNCSFVSGDGAFGFFLPSFAYVVSRRRSRRVFWGGLALGALFGSARILLGAHFLSDVVTAALLSLAASAALHAALFGRRATRELWGLWFIPPRRVSPR